MLSTAPIGSQADKSIYPVCLGGMELAWRLAHAAAAHRVFAAVMPPGVLVAPEGAALALAVHGRPEAVQTR